MKIAIVGSRNINVDNIEEYLPENVTEIVSGGAKGVDTCAKKYALEKGIKFTEFIPQYDHYRKYAPLKRNIDIIEYSDKILIFWDGKSRGTKFVIEECEKRNADFIVYIK